MPTFPLPRWILRLYWRGQLKRAIRKHDLPQMKLALAKGAPLSGWRAKGPWLRVSVEGPGMRMTSRTVLDMAFHWWGTPEMFQLLLDAGANPDGFRYDYEQMDHRAAILDQIGRWGRYKAWVRNHAHAVERLCQSTQQAQALHQSTASAGAHAPLRRL